MNMKRPVSVNGHKEGDTSNRIEGILCNVGIDFVDVLKDDGTVITVLRHSINKIIWPDKDCNPCTCCYDAHTCGCCCEDNHDRIKEKCRCGTHKKQRHQCDCDDHHDDCCCCSRHISPCIPVCQGRIQLRLGRLTENLNFHLFSQKGCKIIIECS